MKKLGQILSKLLTVILVLFTVFTMLFTIISVNTVGKQKALFGYQPYIVLSDSMNGVFEVGDIVVSKEVDPETLKEGDIISFKSIDPNNYDLIVTHKIREVTTYENQKAFVTYGVHTDSDDAYPVPINKVLGCYQFRLPKLGYFFQFLKTPMGYFTLIFIPFMLLIGSEAIRFYKLYKQYKKEKEDELRQHQLESEQLKAEIERLKSQLDQNPKSDER